MAILPFGTGMVVHTLHEEQDIGDPKELFDPVAHEKPDQDMVQLAVQLVERQTAPFEPSDLEDRYEARLRQVIAAKLAGKSVAPAEQAPRRDNVIDLMAALKESLGRGTEGARSSGSRPAASRSRKSTAAQHRKASRKRA